MPVSSQLSGLASISSQVIEIISTILLNYPSVLPLGALLCLVITKWYLYHRHHHHYHHHRHGVSSLFIISAAHWSLFFVCCEAVIPNITQLLFWSTYFPPIFVSTKDCVFTPLSTGPTPHTQHYYYDILSQPSVPFDPQTHTSPLFSSQTNHIRTCSVLKMSNSAKISRQQQQQQLVLVWCGVVCSLCTLCVCVGVVGGIMVEGADVLHPTAPAPTA